MWFLNPFSGLLVIHSLCLIHKKSWIQCRDKLGSGAWWSEVEQEESSPAATNNFHQNLAWTRILYHFAYLWRNLGKSHLLYNCYLFFVQASLFLCSICFCNLYPCLPFWHPIIVLAGSRVENILVVYRGWIPVWNWVSLDQFNDCAESMTTSKAIISFFSIMSQLDCWDQMRWLAQNKNAVNLKPKDPKALFKLSVKGIYSSKRLVVMML